MESIKLFYNRAQIFLYMIFILADQSLGTQILCAEIDARVGTLEVEEDTGFKEP